MSSAALELRPAILRLPAVTSAVTVGVLTLLYLLRQWALPKPLPGIPFNEAAAKIVLGDAAEIRQIKASGGRARVWFGQQTVKHNSPIAQAFLTPFGKPAVILSDYREAQDILLRRGKEFDRASRNVEAFQGVVPWHHIAMTTSDPQFKKNRELVKDLMTHQFLNTVSAPEIYRNTIKFVELWKTKARIASGRPFQADDDVHIMAFDIIKVVALGDGDSASMTDAYAQLVRDSKLEAAGSSPADRDMPFVFPTNKSNADLAAHTTMQDAVGKAITQPFPRLFNYINGRTSKMRQAHADKQRMLGEQVELALQRLRGTDGDADVRSALDHMLRREMAAAAKAGREPVYDSPSMYDELYGYIGAGHDTTSTTLQWALKFLAKHPEAQTKLRTALRAAYPDAAAEKRYPTVTELTARMGNHQVPYLDAVIEETLRLNGPIPTLVREATCDTIVLGHAIPKGTMVFFDIAGPSLLKPSIAVNESVRSDSSRRHRQDHPDMRATWDDMDPSEFRPERWLTTPQPCHSGGAEAAGFDAQAGPILTFSTGVRGCFGRRLAYLELRVVVSLLLWDLELLSLPEELNDWSVVESMTIKPKKCFVRLAEV
ncbi:putative cytochrome P450 [Microdochium bolleyi]|uniref:Putative cytochrome P450 n=1 Tax=Microdochium bolleyi TaxID=196109 RepID=A0A136JD95_9PEZI|nr:putative cytochrome P450 [Microdochium bolleyi]